MSVSGRVAFVTETARVRERSERLFFQLRRGLSANAQDNPDSRGRDVHDRTKSPSEIDVSPPLTPPQIDVIGGTHHATATQNQRTIL